jgi:L-ascorbate metabolism protein UlaG (beta-lactamase superfamily)
MTNLYKKILAILAIVFISNLCFSQSTEIKITFIGNCALYMTDGELNIYVDFPYKSGAHKYMEYDKSVLDSIKDNSIFIFTHRHSDHYSKKLVKKLNGKVYGNWKVSKLEKDLNNTFQEFSIKAYKTSHIFTFKHYSYLITWHNKKIYLNGDTGDIEPVSKIDNIDWAFAPFWLYKNAMVENITIDTKMFGIYHLYPTQKIGEGFPENVHFLTKQNEVISIPY